ncbi:MAG: hypothetical protein WCQ97_02385 [Aminobacterium sp.]|nr:hypothetical protein [Aminobacterium sp.]
MIYELMSTGNIVRLPDAMTISGLPKIEAPNVVLLLPYNRVLIGTSSSLNLEKWVWGKIGEEQMAEVFLYQNKPLMLSVEGLRPISLSVEVVAELRKLLLSQTEPPGEHMPAVLILKGLLRNEMADVITEETLKDEQFILDLIERDLSVKQAYWGIRFALARNDYTSVARIKAWLKSVGSLFDEVAQGVHLWFSLTDLPGRKELADLENLSFTLDDLQRMNSQRSRPVVLFSRSGYLVLSEQSFEKSETVFRIWLYLPLHLWNELREKRKLSIREIISASWGYLEAKEAMREMELYGKRRETTTYPH